MLDGFSAILAAASTATPVPTFEGDPDLVSPGPWGFVAVGLIALAVILLVWDMLRRIRRGRYRAEVREALDAEQAASDAAPDSAAATDPPSTGDDAAAPSKEARSEAPDDGSDEPTTRERD